MENLRNKWWQLPWKQHRATELTEWGASTWKPGKQEGNGKSNITRMERDLNKQFNIWGCSLSEILRHTEVSRMCHDSDWSESSHSVDTHRYDLSVKTTCSTENMEIFTPFYWGKSWKNEPISLCVDCEGQIQWKCARLWSTFDRVAH